MRDAKDFIDWKVRRNYQQCKGMFTWVKEQMPKTPVLVLSTEKSWGSISGHFPYKYFTTGAGIWSVEICTGGLYFKTGKRGTATGRDRKGAERERTDCIEPMRRYWEA